MQKIRVLSVCILALLIGGPVTAAEIDVSFSHTAVAGSPSVYSVSSTFELPPGFDNASLFVDSLSIDGRGVLQLNGVTLTHAGIFGPGDGFMTFTPGGSNDPFTFLHGNGVQNVQIISDFVEGLNTITIIVNDTNVGIGGEPLADGVNISGFELIGRVVFDEPETVPVMPAPFVLTLMLALAAAAWLALRRRMVPGRMGTR